MKRSGRFKRVLACVGAATTIGLTGALLMTDPAAATPTTLKVCNDIESDGNFDVYRLPGAPAGAYNNEIAPGECTGNVNDVSYIRMELHDDNANTWLSSWEHGKDADGYDDGYGANDPDCAAIIPSNAGAVAPDATLLSSLTGAGAITVHIFDPSNCEYDLTTHVQICNDAASVSNFDAFKTDLSYNNELTPGECTNSLNATGSNPVRLDLSDDGAHAIREWKHKQGTAGGSSSGSGGTYSACEREDAVENPVTAGGEDYTILDIVSTEAGDAILPGNHTVRVWADGTSAGTMCGVSGTEPSPDPQPTDGLAGLPTNAASDPPTTGVPNLVDEGAMSDTDLAGQAE